MGVKRKGVVAEVSKMAPDRPPSSHVEVAFRQLQELSLTPRTPEVAERAATGGENGSAADRPRGSVSTAPVSPGIAAAGQGTAEPRRLRVQLPRVEGGAGQRPGPGCPSVLGVACCTHTTSWSRVPGLTCGAEPAVARLELTVGGADGPGLTLNGPRGRG